MTCLSGWDWQLTLEIQGERKVFLLANEDL